jgi:hypothetical protein
MTDINDFILYHGSPKDLKIGNFLDPMKYTRKECRYFGFPIVWATPYKNYAMAFAIEKLINIKNPNDFIEFRQQTCYAFECKKFTVLPAYCALFMYSMTNFLWLKEPLFIYKVKLNSFFNPSNRKPIAESWDKGDYESSFVANEFQFQFYSKQPVEIIAKEHFDIFDFIEFDNSVWHNNYKEQIEFNQESTNKVVLKEQPLFDKSKPIYLTKQIIYEIIKNNYHKNL